MSIFIPMQDQNLSIDLVSEWVDLSTTRSNIYACAVAVVAVAVDPMRLELLRQTHLLDLPKNSISDRSHFLRNSHSPELVQSTQHI